MGKNEDNVYEGHTDVLLRIPHLQLLLCIESSSTIISIVQPISCTHINLTTVLFLGLWLTREFL